ncbi:MAG: hypothetical protein GY716_15140 [bacterium]|nr:hypothetical protein [bacterium]
MTKAVAVRAILGTFLIISVSFAAHGADRRWSARGGGCAGPDKDGDGWAVCKPSCDDPICGDCDDRSALTNPGIVDDTCNATDNDCDGEVDEHYFAAPTTCGIGACEGNMGELACENGAIRDTCDPNFGSIPDTICDGIDNDCDGPIDEDFFPKTTMCGVGECEDNLGQLPCVAGDEVDTCDPLEGASPDTDCDGLDEDCDGAADDDYVPLETACGVGECEGNSGLDVCRNGTLVDTCDPLEGAAPDTNCDGIDDDCDGAADEDYVGSTTTCGVGECEGNEGNFECRDGVEEDTCDPFEGAAPEDAVCDGLDEDCDGEFDEDAADCGDCALRVGATPDPELLKSGLLPGCDLLGRAKSLTFRYTGGGCDATDTLQGGVAVACSGEVDAGAAVEILATGVSPDRPGAAVPGSELVVGDRSNLNIALRGTPGDLGEGTLYIVVPSHVEPGDEFTIYAPDGELELRSSISLSNAGGTESSSFDTSCLLPLAVGDVFGSLTLTAYDEVALDDQLVTYTYEVKNGGDGDLTDVSIVDNRLGTIAEGVDLAPGAEERFTKKAHVYRTTTNEISAAGSAGDGALCTDSGSATVTVVERCDGCDDGRPNSLRFVWTGDGCDDSAHSQGAHADACRGGAFDGPVRVVVRSAGHRRTPTLFDGVIERRDSFEVGDSGPRADALPDALAIRVVDLDGGVVQTLELDTSCVQPLHAGDRFGGLIVTDFLHAEPRQQPRRPIGDRRR